MFVICSICFASGLLIACDRYTPIPENDFVENIFRPVYEQDGAFIGSVSAHNLAVMFMVLAMGTLLDLDQTAHSSESMKLYQLARAALALESVLEEQTIPAIQALVNLHAFIYISSKILICIAVINVPLHVLI